MANYSCRNIANFTTISAPLRELTKINARFEWTAVHQEAFNKLTSALSSSRCMLYFDPKKETQIIVDAIPVGLSAILSQKSKDSVDIKS